MQDIEERIVCEPVRTLTFDSLCARHGIDAIDLLAIDTEGHDWTILSGIDFARWRPRATSTSTTTSRGRTVRPASRTCAPRAT